MDDDPSLLAALNVAVEAVVAAMPRSTLQSGYRHRGLLFLSVVASEAELVRGGGLEALQRWERAAVRFIIEAQGAAAGNERVNDVYDSYSARIAVDGCTDGDRLYLYIQNHLRKRRRWANALEDDGASGGLRLMLYGMPVNESMHKHQLAILPALERLEAALAERSSASSDAAGGCYKKGVIVEPDPAGDDGLSSGCMFRAGCSRYASAAGWTTEQPSSAAVAAAAADAEKAYRKGRFEGVREACHLQAAYDSVVAESGDGGLPRDVLDDIFDRACGGWWVRRRRGSPGPKR